MAYPNVLMIDDAGMYQVMRTAGERGGLVCVHAENGTVIDLLVRESLERGDTGPKFHATTRPAILEGEATGRALTFAGMTGSPTYFVHLSAASALKDVAIARGEGRPVYAETCPHYLLLTEEEYERPGFEAAKYVMTPPLRSREHQDALWRGLRTGALSSVSTDHCPFCYSLEPFGAKYSKQQGREDFSKIPNGAPGIETRLPLLYDGGVRTGRLSLNRLVDLTSTMPARIFGLFPKKGTIAPGSDADYVVFDPDETWTIEAAREHSRVDYSLFEGREVTGRVKRVYLRGELIVDGTEWLGREGGGTFLKRSEHAFVS
jgi:dihydropyrimidinase